MKTNRMAMSTAAGIAAFSLALAGCSGSDSGDTSGGAESSPAASDSSTGSETEAATDDQTDDESGDSGKSLPADADLSQEAPSVTPEDAIKTATEKAGDGIVHGIELDWDEHDEAWQYEVSILTDSTDHDVEIDAETRKVVKHEKDSTNDKEEAIDLKDPMTFDEALKLAQEKSDGKLVSWKYEYDDGQHEFQFDFDKDGQDTETTVDANSKRVTVDDD
jgi:uncharacterized membrane protein YkoI